MSLLILFQCICATDPIGFRFSGDTIFISVSCGTIMVTLLTDSQCPILILVDCGFIMVTLFTDISCGAIMVTYSQMSQCPIFSSVSCGLDRNPKPKFFKVGAPFLKFYFADISGREKNLKS
eukprot:TRINITY_DN4009_c0_g1_i1.p1 TRINITY_DN4009_c0_g1~~TRINITY_DN4009_c0_g1_i1.p1  ORF type:complete len:121 (-),score=3.12 TRINITY_DN4009_c0_g1_i1:93-455(-)